MTEDSNGSVQALVVKGIELPEADGWDAQKYGGDGIYLVHWKDKADREPSVMQVWSGTVCEFMVGFQLLEPVVRWNDYKEMKRDLVNGSIDREQRSALEHADRLTEMRKSCEEAVAQTKAELVPGGISEATHVRVMELMVEQVKTMVKGGK